jgi:hypothetical protein
MFALTAKCGQRIPATKDFGHFPLKSSEFNRESGMSDTKRKDLCLVNNEKFKKFLAIGSVADIL